MALAGYDTQTSMEMLPNVLNLAAAGNMDLARASDMVTDTQTAFGISLDRTSQMVDEMAKAASTGNTSVEQLGDAFLVVGGLAQEMNGGMVQLSDGTTATYDNVQELEIALTAMANAGIKGSEAGTHMRNMLLKLASPTEDGSAALDMLGVSIFDDTGKMRGLNEVFGELNTVLNNDATPALTKFYEKFAGMSPESIMKEFQKAPEDFDFFGLSVVDAEGHLKDFNSLMEESKTIFAEGLSQEGKLQVISDVFNTRDTAAAEALLQAVSGDWDSIAESILDADGAAEAMADTQLDNLAGDVTLFQSALEGAKIAVSDGLTPTLREFVQFGTDGLSRITDAFKKGGITGAMAEFGTVLSDGIAMVTDMLPDAINAGMELLGAVGQGILDNLPAIVDAAVQIVVELANGLVSALPELARGVVTLIESLKASFSENKEALINTGKELLTFIVNGLANNLPAMVEGITQMISGMAIMLSDSAILSPLIEGAINIILALADGLLKSVPILIETIPVIIENLVNALIDNAPTLILSAISLLGMIAQTIIENLPLIIAAGIQIITALTTGIIQMIPFIVTAILGLISELTRTLLASLPKFLENGVKIVGAIVEGIVKTLGAIIEAAINLVNQFIDGMARGWGKIIQAGMDIINNVRDGIMDKIDEARDWGKDLIDNFIDGIEAKAQALWDTVSGIAQGVKDFLGFSEPEKGPLSNFHTYAPDMMDLFAKGIKDNKNRGVDTVADAFDFQDLITTPSTETATTSNGSSNNQLAPNNVIMNIYGAAGQDINELADIVSKRLNDATGRRMVAMGVM
jgi:phage-related protein